MKIGTEYTNALKELAKIDKEIFAVLGRHIRERESEVAKLRASKRGFLDTVWGIPDASITDAEVPYSTATDAEVVSPYNVFRLMPLYEDIPEEFRDDSSKWCRVVSRWFSSEFDIHGPRLGLVLHAKEGINYESAIRHCKSILRSFEPKHEEKIAGVAYLASLWFEMPV